jgi:prepilin-type N-terminal cleavage/methylation domain-containing protein
MVPTFQRTDLTRSHSNPHGGRCAEHGYSMIELLITVAIAGVLAAFAVPMISATLGSYKLSGDLHDVSNALALTKMRAAASFTRARLYVSLSGNTFHLETWNSATAAWVTEGATTTLAAGDSFGFGAVGTPPPSSQAAIGQASACLDTASPPNPIGNTACVFFNSRGIPVDPTTLNPTASYALYLTDGTFASGCTISATGSIRSWQTVLSAVPTWTRQ